MSKKQQRYLQMELNDKRNKQRVVSHQIQPPNFTVRRLTVGGGKNEYYFSNYRDNIENDKTNIKPIT